MGDDASSDIKADLVAGTYTNYTGTTPPIIYIENKDEFNGGKVYILLRSANRDPVQTVSGSVLYTGRSCSIIIVANSITNKDNLYLDIVNILTATARGYKIGKGRDQPRTKTQTSILVPVSMLL